MWSLIISIPLMVDTIPAKLANRSHFSIRHILNLRFYLVSLSPTFVFPLELFDFMMKCLEHVFVLTLDESNVSLQLPHPLQRVDAGGSAAVSGAGRGHRSSSSILTQLLFLPISVFWGRFRIAFWRSCGLSVGMASHLSNLKQYVSIIMKRKPTTSSSLITIVRKTPISRYLFRISKV